MKHYIGDERRACGRKDEEKCIRKYIGFSEFNDISRRVLYDYYYTIVVIIILLLYSI